MANAYTVAQVNRYIKRIVEQEIALTGISVKGEVSNCKYHTSGHIYFTLKDAESMIACVMFASARGVNDIRLRDGMQIVAKGNIRIYERDGKYQLYVTKLEQEGIGDLYRIFAQRKQAMEKMGMFAPEYKKPLPRYAMKIGVATASTGAAIHDIVSIAQRRNPYVQLYLYPTIVQGKEAPASIVHAITQLDEMGLDCIIVGRGGGSIEDLWAFNEEIVATAIFECNTPIISAVGHETDITIADYVADRRAPTPSAAAELAVFDYNQLKSELMWYQDSMKKKLEQKKQEKLAELNQVKLKLRLLHPGVKLENQKNELQYLKKRYKNQMQNVLNHSMHQIALYAQKLEGVSPLKRLSGGYAFVTGEDQKPIESIAQLDVSDMLCLHMRDGIVNARVEQIKKRL